MDRTALQESVLLEDLSAIALTPVSLRRIFLLLTRLHWSDDGNFGDVPPSVRKFKFHKDPKVRTLLVDNDYVYDAKKSDHCPAIFVGCSDVVFTRKVVNNQRGSDNERAASEHAKTAAVNMIVSHYTHSADDSLMLAEISAQFFMGIQTMMQDQLQLRSYEVVSISRPRVTGGSGPDVQKQFAVDLLINIEFNALWKIFRESHRIKNITLSLAQSELSIP